MCEQIINNNKIQQFCFNIGKSTPFLVPESSRTEQIIDTSSVYVCCLIGDETAPWHCQDVVTTYEQFSIK